MSRWCFWYQSNNTSPIWREHGTCLVRYYNPRKRWKGELVTVAQLQQFFKTDSNNTLRAPADNISQAKNPGFAQRPTQVSTFLSVMDYPPRDDTPSELPRLPPGQCTPGYDILGLTVLSGTDICTLRGAVSRGYVNTFLGCKPNTAERHAATIRVLVTFSDFSFPPFSNYLIRGCCFSL